jgi:hypothetical protein
MKNEEGFKYIKPKSINKILMRLRGEILELLTHKNDRGFWKDINKEWLNTKSNYTNRSTDKEDIDTNTTNDIHKVAKELIQISLFGRILQTNEEDEIINLPKLHLPYFYKQSLGASFTDLYNISSQKAFMKMDEKNSMMKKSIGKKKNKNLNMIRKVVSHTRNKQK